jgi:hypothetical protein
MLNYMCGLSEHQQGCGFHWQTKKMKLNSFLCHFVDWLFLALHLVNTPISNHGDGTEKTMIHLQWQHSENQENECSVIAKDFHVIKWPLRPSGLCPGYEELNEDGIFSYRAYHEEFASKSSLQCGSARREPCMTVWSLLQIEEMPSAKSLVRGIPHLGSLYREVLPSARYLRHFFTVERVFAFVS